MRVVQMATDLVVLTALDVLELWIEGPGSLEPRPSWLVRLLAVLRGAAGEA